MKRIEVKNSRKYALIIIDIYGIRPFQLQYCCILYVLQVWKSLLKVTRYSLWVALAINTRQTKFYSKLLFHLKGLARQIFLKFSQVVHL